MKPINAESRVDVNSTNIKILRHRIRFCKYLQKIQLGKYISYCTLYRAIILTKTTVKGDDKITRLPLIQKLNLIILTDQKIWNYIDRVLLLRGDKRYDFIFFLFSFASRKITSVYESSQVPLNLLFL